MALIIVVPIMEYWIRDISCIVEHCCSLIPRSLHGYETNTMTGASYIHAADFILWCILLSTCVIMQIGTYQLAVMAKALNKPFYVVAESFKFVRLFPLNQDDLPNVEKVSLSPHFGHATSFCFQTDCNFFSICKLAQATIDFILMLLQYSSITIGPVLISIIANAIFSSSSQKWEFNHALRSMHRHTYTCSKIRDFIQKHENAMILHN